MNTFYQTVVTDNSWSICECLFRDGIICLTLPSGIETPNNEDIAQVIESTRDAFTKYAYSYHPRGACGARDYTDPFSDMAYINDDEFNLENITVDEYLDFITERDWTIKAKVDGNIIILYCPSLHMFDRAVTVDEEYSEWDEYHQCDPLYRIINTPEQEYFEARLAEELPDWRRTADVI